MGNDLRADSNNLTLARLMMAAAVIYTHCYYLVSGDPTTDPVSWLFKNKISHLAVDGFFFLSGFLVYRSLCRRNDVAAFAQARFLRLWPGLAAFVAVSLVVGFFLGAAWGPETHAFTFSTLLLQPGEPYLSGIAGNINYSLWTIAWEVRCYAFLALLFLLGLTSERAMIRFVLPATMILAIAFKVAHGQDPIITPIVRFWGMFALGIAAYIFRERIPLTWWALPPLLVANYVLPHVGVNMLLTGYFVLCLGFTLPVWSARWPDYSYGLNVYAYPVMLLIWGAGLITSFSALVIANFLATLLVGAVSWHFIEKPAMTTDRSSLKRVATAGGLAGLIILLDTHASTFASF